MREDLALAAKALFEEYGGRPGPESAVMVPLAATLEVAERNYEELSECSPETLRLLASVADSVIGANWT